MDDLNLPRTEASCPVPDCLWTYDMTNPRTEGDPRGDGPLRVVIPPPAGEHLRPEEITAGINARPKMAAAPALAGMDSIVELMMQTAVAQDDAVCAAHLGGHSYAELAAAFGDGLGAALDLLAAAGYHPPVSISLPSGPRLVAYWEDDVTPGYQCSVCHTVRASGPDTAQHFTEAHTYRTEGINIRELEQRLAAEQ